MVLDPHFLARAAKANEKDIGPSVVDPRDEVVHLLGRKIPVLEADDVDPRVTLPQDLDCLAVGNLGRAVDEYAVVACGSHSTNSLHEISAGHSSEFTAIKESSRNDDANAVRDDQVSGFKKRTEPDDRSDLVHLLRIGTNDVGRRGQTPDAIIDELQDGAHGDRMYRKLKYMEAVHVLDVRLESVRRSS
jgi:hypothetical protein